MKNVLSTKLLTSGQKKILNDAGINFQEYEAINIHYQEFQLTANFDYFIFTSQNAVRAFINHNSNFPIKKKLGRECFCVGEKTKSLLEKNGYKVVKMAHNGAELGVFIAKNYKKESFLFFCGNRRNDDLPNILTKHKIHFKEIIVYQTELNPQHFSEPFDGILFFSPSGVKSFTLSNEVGNSTVFCIGHTTAGEAALFTDSIVVADTPVVENLLKKVSLHYNLSIKK
ncbi:MAG: uroporphyrinogen-III synthase [Eudoraea sp.]|uniref:uroporphyrinogen-III synthase n=1 Tax=Eudoraea sp. TaxID=1979955 RepID=UPI003C736C53